MIDISKLRGIRKQKRLTQKELAKQSRVSQSLIARIEKGEIDPSYSKAMRIINVLQNENEKEIQEIMNRKILLINPDDEIKKAANIMRKKAISQLPVVREDKVIGTVTESSISKIFEKPDLKFIREVMDQSLPTIDKSSPFSLLSELLKHSSAVLITDYGKLCGIVTKADLLRVI